MIYMPSPGHARKESAALDPRIWYLLYVSSQSCLCSTQQFTIFQCILCTSIDNFSNVFLKLALIVTIHGLIQLTIPKRGNPILNLIRDLTILNGIHN